MLRIDSAHMGPAVAGKPNQGQPLTQGNRSPELTPAMIAAAWTRVEGVPRAMNGDWPELRKPHDGMPLSALVRELGAVSEHGDKDAADAWLGRIHQACQGALQSLDPSLEDASGLQGERLGSPGEHPDAPPKENDLLFMLLSMWREIKLRDAARYRELADTMRDLQVDANEAQRKARINAAIVRVFEAFAQGAVTTGISFGGAAMQIKGHGKLRQCGALDEAQAEAVRASAQKLTTHGMATMSATPLGAALGSTIAVGASEEESEAQRFDMAQRLAEQAGGQDTEKVRSSLDLLKDLYMLLKSIMDLQLESTRQFTRPA